MKRTASTLVASLALVLGATAIGAEASSAATTKAPEKHRQRGARGPRGPRGFQGSPGQPGATGPQGPAGRSAGANFNAALSGNASESLTIGAFTISETASGGSCGVITIGSTAASLVSIGTGTFNPLMVVPAGSTTAIVVPPKTDIFTAVTTDGTSTVSGHVGAASSGGSCITTGFATGT